MCSLELTNAKKLCCWSNIKGFFRDALGLTHFLEIMGAVVTLKPNFELLWMKLFEFQWRNELSRTTSRNKTGGNKLRTHYRFHKNFDYEKYLDFQGDFTLRRNITKIITSSHQLEIETGHMIDSEVLHPTKEKLVKQLKMLLLPRMYQK